MAGLHTLLQDSSNISEGLEKHRANLECARHDCTTSSNTGVDGDACGQQSHQLAAFLRYYQFFFYF